MNFEWIFSAENNLRFFGVLMNCAVPGLAKASASLCHLWGVLAFWRPWRPRWKCQDLPWYFSIFAIGWRLVRDPRLDESGARVYVPRWYHLFASEMELKGSGPAQTWETGIHFKKAEHLWSTNGIRHLGSSKNMAWEPTVVLGNLNGASEKNQQSPTPPMAKSNYLEEFHWVIQGGDQNQCGTNSAREITNENDLPSDNLT